MSLKIMLADDHAMFREGIKRLLAENGKYEVVAEAGNGFECLEKIKEDTPELLILDIHMPEMSGIEVLEELRTKKVDVKVLMLTFHSEVEYLVNAMDLGANGYLLKEASFEELECAIKEIAEGKNYVQSRLVPALESRLINRDADRMKLETLTRRELEILSQIASGLFNKEIGINLDISERTVKNHISNIFKKIDVSDRTQAAVFAIRNNIVKLY